MRICYFPQLVQESDPVEKKTLAKQSKFLLIRTDKILILSIIALGMNLIMVSDKIGMIRCLLKLSFISLSIYLIMMPDENKGLCLVL